MKRLFLFHWNHAEAQEKAEELRALGWEVDFEAEDGARGGNAVLANPPEVMVVYLTRLPSHGRQTAAYLRTRPATKTLPMVFVDGEGEPLEKTKAKVPDGVYTTAAKLPLVLEKIAKAKPAVAPKAVRGVGAKQNKKSPKKPVTSQ